MAKTKGPWWARTTKAAILGAAIGAAAPSQASQLHYDQSVARNQARQNSKNPNEADQIELDGITNRVTQSDGGGSSSLSVKQNGNRGVTVALEFEAPIPTDEMSSISTATENKTTPNTQQRPTKPASPNRDVTSASTIDSKPDEANLLADDTKPFSNTVDENTNSTIEESKEGEAKEENMGQMLEEGMRAEAELEQATLNADAQKKLDQKNQVQKEGVAQVQAALQARQAQAASVNPLTKELMKAIQTKQRLDRRLSRLKNEKRVLTFALYSAKILKAIVDVVQAGVKWLAGVCMSLAWTIVLAIIGVILYLIYGLLWIPKGALLSMITILQKRIDSIKKDIDKTEKTQQNAVAVIKSIQRKMRTGQKRPPQKYPMPQQA